MSDGKDVFAFLGKGGVHSISLDGEKKWSVDIGKESSNRQWGSAASLLLFGDTIIVNAAEESRSIIALNKATGEEVWRQEANMLELTYGTPRIVPLADGEHELVISVPSETRRSGTLVYEPGDAFQPISQNKFADDETDFNASPAVSDGRLYLRSNQSLSCVAQ